MQDTDRRERVLHRYGCRCFMCGEMLNLQVHHLMPRSHGGELVVENEVPVCGPWSRKSKYRGGCHRAITEHEVKVSLRRLLPDTVRYLAEKGWVYEVEESGDGAGGLGGRGCRGFLR